jgi:hypothetical protein
VKQAKRKKETSVGVATGAKTFGIVSSVVLLLQCVISALIHVIGWQQHNL